ncbi:MAG: hypothetical protein V3V18_07075 [Methylococcales bacterium]
MVSNVAFVRTLSWSKRAVFASGTVVPAFFNALCSNPSASTFDPLHARQLCGNVELEPQ